MEGGSQGMDEPLRLSNKPCHMRRFACHPLSRQTEIIESVVVASGLMY